jgi:23S rRNA (pseudouridine1915-N3)-methyltransferase
VTVKLRVAWIQARAAKQKSREAQKLAEGYAQRLSHYAPLDLEPLASTSDLFKVLEREKKKAPAFLVLLDSRGTQLTSEQLAGFLDQHMQRATQQLCFVVGGPDGFNAETRKAANYLLSLGPMTLPHELARVILLEQLYRAFTILKGHPYHSGH